MKQALFESKNKSLLFLLIIIIFLRISVLFFAYAHPERTFTNDSYSYIEPAQFLLRDHAYTHPSTLRTPAYPLFLAGIFALFGERPFFVVLAQVLIGLATIFITYKMSSDLFPGQNGLQGILLLGLGLESILSPFYLMTETLFSFFLVLIAFSLLRYKHSLKIDWALACAVFSALAILCRPIALYLPVLILFFFIWENRQKCSVAIRIGAVYLLITAISVIPWVVRNYHVVGLPIVSSITGDSLLFYSANALRAHEKGITFFESQKQIFEEFEQRATQEGIPYTEKDRYNLKISMGKKIIAHAPVTYLWVHVRDSLKVFLPGTASLNEMMGLPTQSIQFWDVLRTQSPLSALASYFEQSNFAQIILLPFILLLIMTIFGAAVGTLILFKGKNWFALLLLLIPLIYLILLSGPGSYSRFRVPLMPFLSILAGIGLPYMKNLIWRKTK